MHGSENSRLQMRIEVELECDQKPDSSMYVYEYKDMEQSSEKTWMLFKSELQ